MRTYKFVSLQGTNVLYRDPKLQFSNQSYMFFIENFLAAFKGKGLHMDRNEVFGTWNLIFLQICFKHMFIIKALQALHVIMVHQFIKKACIIPLIGGIYLSLGCFFSLQKVLVWVTQMNYMTKNLPKNSHLSFKLSDSNGIQTHNHLSFR